MPFQLTPDTFFRCLQRSALVSEDRVASLVVELGKEGVDVGQPQAIAAALVRNGTLTQWQAKELLRGKHRGFILGKYRLLSVLARGGTSTVYLAEHSLMRRRCAIKVLPKTNLRGAVDPARFQRETRVVAALEHTNIVRAYDVDKALDGKNEVHLFVMEFVDGDSLQDRVAHMGPMPPLEAANYIRQAADGLAYAHSCGVVHGNVKPANLLVARGDIIKILDLGLAKLFNDVTPAPIEKEQALATANFLAPEQFVKGGTVDRRTDIYSLGCTFHFLLAGLPPFPGGTPRQTLISPSTKQPVSIREIRDDVPADLAEILSRMMARQPADRYRTADEVSDELRKSLVKHADPKWLRQNPAVLSSPNALEKRTANRSTDAKTPSPVSAAPSAAIRTGSTSAEPSDSSSKSNASPSNGARPSEASTALVKGSTPSERSTPPPTSAKSRATTVGIDVLKVLRIDQHDSSVIDTVIGRRRRKPWFLRVRPKLSLEIIALVLASAVAAVGGLVWYGSREKDLPVHPIEQKSAKLAAVPGPAAAPAPTRPLIDGDIRVGPRGHFKTIGEAIDFVRESYAHDVLFSTSTGKPRAIKVAGWHTYPERIDIDNSDFHFPKALRIICDDPVPAILAPPDHEPVVRLHGVERFSLDGFEIDAAGKKAAIDLSGYLVGTRLRNLEIGGDCDTSILVHGAMGLERPESRCILDHLVLRRRRPGGTGVRFEQGINPSSNLTITGCRLFGPFESAIAFNGPAVGIAVRESIISRASVGILFERDGLAVKDLAIVNNTFHKLDRGIVFRDTPPGPTIDLTVQRNLFDAVANSEMFVERGSDRAGLLARFPKGAITGNWTSRKVDTPLPDGQIDLFASGGQTGAALKFQTNDQDDARFLAPTADAPHKTLGAVILK
ncbi:MAG TPA: protein kinase [Planctomycetaceae bacterium]|jgi:serine/threonine-protein kinase|nr:protein kinase [Planctomycetaceae bacterium]